jgi:hypothetical protein
MGRFDVDPSLPEYDAVWLEGATRINGCEHVYRLPMPDDPFDWPDVITYFCPAGWSLEINMDARDWPDLGIDHLNWHIAHEGVTL